MFDKLLNTLKLQSTILPYADSSPYKSSYKQKMSTNNLSNPEDDTNSSWLIQNDYLFKIMGMDNGNGIKDCKAMLDMMKYYFIYETYKLSLFYQPDLNELLYSLKVNDINIKKIIINKAGEYIEAKVKNIKIKKRNEIFANYSKLMKYSLRENERINFIKESAKINQGRHEGSIPLSGHYVEYSQLHNIKNYPQKYKTISILYKMMQYKRNKIAIENSSKMNQEWKELEGIMKNRAMCEKILYEALMFERYYHIMKKEKQKVLEGDGVGGGMDTGLGKRRLKTYVGSNNKNNGLSNTKNHRLSQSFYKRPRTSANHNQLSSSATKKPTVNQKTNTSIDPRHLRLPYSIAYKSSSFITKPHMTYQDYYRYKFMVGLKRDEYLRQLNRVNDEIVEKKNMRNNCLIGNVLGLIRENTMGGNKANSNDVLLDNTKATEILRKSYKRSMPSRNISKSRLGNDSSNRKRMDDKKSMFANNDSNKVSYLTGSYLTKILRRLFLIYSSSNNNTSHHSISSKGDGSLYLYATLITLTTPYESLTQMSQRSLQRFFADFNLYNYLESSNDKIYYILYKDWIDYFEFIQLIHLLSAAMHETHSHNESSLSESDSTDSMIYTNINYWISRRIFDMRYMHLLEIKEQSLLHKMRRDLVRLRKYYRLYETLNSKIDEFIVNYRVNKLKVKTFFYGFDEVLEMLWSLKVYPQFVNKKVCRFYFYYLKEDNGMFLLKDAMIRVKRSEHVIVENIIWLIVANRVISDSRVNRDHNTGYNSAIITKDKMMEKVFAYKFKHIINSINNCNTKNDNLSKNFNTNDDNDEYGSYNLLINE